MNLSDAFGGASAAAAWVAIAVSIWTQVRQSLLERRVERREVERRLSLQTSRLDRGDLHLLARFRPDGLHSRYSLTARVLSPATALASKADWDGPFPIRDADAPGARTLDLTLEEYGDRGEWCADLVLAGADGGPVAVELAIVDQASKENVLKVRRKLHA